MDRHQRNLRTRMNKDHQKRFKIRDFQIGDVISLKLFDKQGKDKKHLMQSRVFGRIIGVPARDSYTLQTRFGILKNTYAPRSINLVKAKGEFIPAASPYNIADNPTTIHLNEIICMLAPQSGGELISCTCGGLCSNERCKCFKSLVSCGPRCHQRHTKPRCCNKSKLDNEVAHSSQQADQSDGLTDSSDQRTQWSGAGPGLHRARPGPGSANGWPAPLQI